MFIEYYKEAWITRLSVLIENYLFWKHLVQQVREVNIFTRLGLYLHC